MKTLEQQLRSTVEGENKDNEKIQYVPDFRVVVQGDREGGVHFIIHPDGHSGDTLDFIAKGNELIQLA